MLGFGLNNFCRKNSSMSSIGIITDQKKIFNNWSLLKAKILVHAWLWLKFWDQGWSQCYTCFNFFCKSCLSQSQACTRVFTFKSLQFLKIICWSVMIPMLIWSLNFADGLPCLAFAWPSVNTAWNPKISKSSWM